MPQTHSEENEALPRLFQLMSFAPSRAAFSWEAWDPIKVVSAADLPPYLILGNRDDGGFERRADGWIGRWIGTSSSINFTVIYSASEHRYEISQRWFDVEGRAGFYSAKTRLDRSILQGLYMQFPSAWDAKAKERLEAEFQLTYFEQPTEAFNMCGMPDGPLRSVVFPLPVESLRLAREWLQALSRQHFPYPIAAKAVLISQSINYVEGKAPDWTRDEGQVFFASLRDAGFPPNGPPVREVAPNGSAAWTLRRSIYAVFVKVPFAGLVDLLSRAASPNGPIRRRSDEELGVDMTPIVIPTAFEYQVSDLHVWDRQETTRCFWHFSRAADRNTLLRMEAQTISDGSSAKLLEQAEKIGAQAISDFEKLVREANAG